MSGFISGRCPHCGDGWSVPTAGHRRQVYCGNRCRQAAHRARERARQKDRPRLQPGELNARLRDILARVATGELTQLPGNCCAECECKVDVDTEPMTGRTRQYCGCGTHYIGRWAA